MCFSPFLVSKHLLHVFSTNKHCELTARLQSALDDILRTSQFSPEESSSLRLIIGGLGRKCVGRAGFRKGTLAITYDTCGHIQHMPDVKYVT